MLDANNNIVTDANGNPVLTSLTAVDQYSRTLHAAEGRLYSDRRSAQLGGGASQFTIQMPAILTPASSSTISASLRRTTGACAPTSPSATACAMKWQTNISDHGDFAPRIGFAWAPGSAKNGRQKTVFRGGFGIFYDRVN